MFKFKEFNNLCNDEIRLTLKSKDEPDIEKGYAPRYGFSIIHIKDNEDIGVVYFSVDSSKRQYIYGHLSYGVSPAYAGHNYAMKACKLIKEDRKSTRLNSSHVRISYAVFCLKKKINS